MDALDALADHLRRYIIERETDPRLRTVCLLLREFEIERLRRMRLERRPGWAVSYRS
jgi:hypothetical protein